MWRLCRAKKIRTANVHSNEKVLIRSSGWSISYEPGIDNRLSILGVGPHCSLNIASLLAKAVSCGVRSASNTFGGMRMEPYQWFLLGIMVAFTPSLLVLGVLLARSVDQPADTTEPRD